MSAPIVQYGFAPRFLPKNGKPYVATSFTRAQAGASREAFTTACLSEYSAKNWAVLKKEGWRIVRVQLRFWP